MNSRGRSSSSRLSVSYSLRGSTSSARGRGGPNRGARGRGGGIAARGGYQRAEWPQYDGYGYQDGYQGGYGRGPQGGLMPPQLNPPEWEAERDMMERQREMLLEQRRMLEEQQARLEQQARQIQHSYTQLGPEQRGFKRPAYPPALLGPPQPKRFPGGGFPPGFRPPSLVPPLPRDALRPLRAPNRSLHIFRGSELMSSTVKARIDACVGLVVREMRAHVFGPTHLEVGHWELKKLKKAIRERIYAMLMNKAVGSNDELFAKYRALHPRKDDEAFVKTIKESMDEEVGVKYMSENLSSALTVKLEEMFTKLSKIYDESEHVPPEVTQDAEMKEEPTETIPSEPEEAETDKSKNSGTQKDAETKEVNKQEKDKAKADAENEYLKERLDAMLKEKLPVILPYFKRSLIEIMCKDGQFTYHEEEQEDGARKNGTAEKHENGGGDADVSAEGNGAVADVGMAEESTKIQEERIKNEAEEMDELLSMIKNTTEADQVEKPPEVKTPVAPSRVNTRRSSRLPKN